ncbi:Golgi to ER traffic protein 4 homolog [Rhopilema esculentum]|uniref:Golgi to ER traffic protein 4 homolog n=1 Tax=Rhopilema esculentum TaxID=499914 RepID=UPI0031D29238
MASGRSRNDKARGEKIYQRIASKVEDGDHYEATQIAKTLFFRYKVQGNFEEAVKICYRCATLLLKQSQHENGIDLARDMIKCYNEGKVNVNDDNVDRIVEILNLCEKNSPSREDFLRESLQWSNTGYKFGHPKIHQAVAIKYWEERNYSSARQHFAHGQEGELYGAFLVEYHVTSGYPGEIDLFVTQAVLQILCLQRIPAANILFFTYTGKHPGIKRCNKPYKQPLLNFIAFLLLAVEIGSLQQFTTLCEQYHPSISRDPMYFEYLDKIGQVFFGVPPKESKKKDGFVGMLDDIMRNMMGDSPMEIEAAVEEEAD